MSQTISQQTSPYQPISPVSGGKEAPSWLLEADRELLRHLYAQRIEQLEQRVAQQEVGANQRSISIVESQIDMLNHAIREAEEQATLHARQIEIRVLATFAISSVFRATEVRFSATSPCPCAGHHRTIDA